MPTELVILDLTGRWQEIVLYLVNKGFSITVQPSTSRVRIDIDTWDETHLENFVAKSHIHTHFIGTTWELKESKMEG